MLTADAFDGLTAADIDLSNNIIPTFPAAAFSTQNLNSMWVRNIWFSTGIMKQFIIMLWIDYYLFEVFRPDY